MNEFFDLPVISSVIAAASDPSSLAVVDVAGKTASEGGGLVPFLLDPVKIAAVVGAVLGALGKWLLDQWSAERTAEREFAKQATQQVVDLSSKYYWSLANYAGMLSFALSNYLQQRALLLMQMWGDPERPEDVEQIRRMLDDLAKDAANHTFPMVCRLVGLFDDFQFSGSNTYLLKTHYAGETCRQLYNLFIESLRSDQVGGFSTRNVASVMRSAPAGQPEQRVLELPSQIFMDTVARLRLANEHGAWEVWLRDQTPDVARAADALLAYSELINHELAHLYRAFFGRGGNEKFRRMLDRLLRKKESKQYATAANGQRWPEVISRTSLETLELVGHQSSLYRALGAVSLPARSEPSEGRDRPAKAYDRPAQGRDQSDQQSSKSPVEKGVTEGWKQRG